MELSYFPFLLTFVQQYCPVDMAAKKLEQSLLDRTFVHRVLLALYNPRHCSYLTSPYSHTDSKSTEPHINNSGPLPSSSYPEACQHLSVIQKPTLGVQTSPCFHYFSQLGHHLSTESVQCLKTSLSAPLKSTPHTVARVTFLRRKRMRSHPVKTLSDGLGIPSAETGLFILP